MLLVSAIVLSTSTYAWFSAGAAVSVEQITANVTHTDGSVVIRAADLSGMTEAQLTAAGLTAADVDWTSDLKQDVIDYLFGQESQTNFVKPGNLVPITVDPGTATETSGIYSGTMYNRSGTFSSELFDHDNDEADTEVAVKSPRLPVYKLVTGANGSGSGNYLTYQFTIWAKADCEVTLTPTFNSGKNFLFGAVNVDGNTYIYNANASTYVPVKASQTIRDIDRDGIIESADYSSSTGEGDNIATYNVTSTALENKTVSSRSSGAITLDFDSAGAVSGNGGTKTVTVYIWAEGQQADCSGACDPSTASFSFAAIKA
ncbi:MAG: hypothetical protein K5756_01355 [Clostridiales bacterium]|nr:hypothetical protein [Clostridiales bacterium]